MRKQMLAAALGAAASFAMTSGALSAPVVTSGSATIAFTLPLAGYDLRTNLALNADGEPERSFTATPSGLDDQNRPTGTGSQVTPGGALLSLRGSMYLYPLNTAGEEVADFADVKTFGFRDDRVSEELRAINFVPTADPNVFADIRDPSSTYAFTDEQIGWMNDGQLRLCCRHTLGGFQLDTVAGTLDGVIDNIAERDINFDGVIDASDEFHLFDLVATGDADVFDLALTQTFAEFLNIAFFPQAFLDGDVLTAEWARLLKGGSPLLGFQGGEIVGAVSYALETADVAPVPVPAALPLMAAGLGLLGLVRARRRPTA